LTAARKWGLSILSPISILVVDDHVLVREAIARLLAREPECAQVAQASTVAEAIDILKQRPVDLVLLDIDLGAERGGAFVLQARSLGYHGKILVLTAGIPEREAGELLKLGVHGIFLKSRPPALLAESIRRVLAGELWLDEHIQASSAAGRKSAPPEARTPLTQRERDVLRGVFEGLANKEIAARLNISESSVKMALQQLFDKTGVRTRAQLTRVALERYLDQI
jgi:DNA-binding NarL/FixJ family response regulator